MTLEIDDSFVQICRDINGVGAIELVIFISQKTSEENPRQ